MENLDEALATLINTALSGIDASVGFLQAELPDVIVQLLMWHGVKSGVVSLLAIIFIVVVAKIDISFGKKLHAQFKEDNDEPLFWGLYIGAGSLLRIFLYIMPFDLYINLTWLQIWIAPKVWLLEYAARMVN